MVFREEDINYNKELDPLARKIEMTYLIGRKISRQWLSTVVSPSWWSHLWLNEGIATYVYIADVVNKVNFLYISYVILLKNRMHF